MKTRRISLRLRRTRTISALSLAKNFVEVLAFVAAIFGIYAYFDGQNSDRKKTLIAETLRYSNSFNDEYYQKDRFLLIQIWLRRPDLAKKAAISMTPNERSKLIERAVNYTYGNNAVEFRTAVYHISEFYDSVGYCIEHDLCDACIAHDIFATSYSDFLLYRHYIEELAVTFNDAQLGKVLSHHFRGDMHCEG